jgi:hypothetical protein
MAKRKYTRMGEKPTKYECCNKKCKWQGTFEEKEEIETESGSFMKVCPNCFKEDFYGLLESVEKVTIENKSNV